MTVGPDRASHHLQLLSRGLDELRRSLLDRFQSRYQGVYADSKLDWTLDEREGLFNMLAIPTNK